MICLVLGIFYMVGWEIGGVEAVSLSILVGSSVDYCMHLVEGYLIAGKAVPYHCKEVRMTICYGNICHIWYILMGSLSG